MLNKIHFRYSFNGKSSHLALKNKKNERRKLCSSMDHACDMHVCAGSILINASVCALIMNACISRTILICGSKDMHDSLPLTGFCVPFVSFKL